MIGGSEHRWTDRPLHQRLRFGVIGVGVSIVLTFVGALGVALIHNPPSDSSPNGFHAVAVVLLLAGAMLLVGFSVVLLLDCFRWRQERRRADRTGTT